MSVNINISDLFFNRDFDHVKRYDKRGHFQCFDKALLREEAVVCLSSIARLGPTACGVPTADELVEDFLARV